MVYLAITITTLLLFVFCSLFRNQNGIPTNWPIVGMIPALVKNIHRFHSFFIEVKVKVNSTYFFKGPWFTNMCLLVTVDPANVQHILCKQPQNYVKGSTFNEILEFLGDGIFNSEFVEWKYHQKVVHSFFSHPSFHHSLDHFTSKKVDNGLIPILDHASKHQIEIDLKDILLRFTYDTISMFMMNHDPRSLSIDLPSFPPINSMACIMQAIFFRQASPKCIWKLMKWFNVGIEKRHKEGVKILDDFIYMCINKRREEIKIASSTINDNNNKDQDIGVTLDLLGFLMMEKNENIDYLTKGHNNMDKYLRDMVSNFLLAGAESTSSALTWFFYLLSKNPQVISNIKEELEKNNMKQTNNGFIITRFRELSDKLIYLHATLYETLRLYPPVPFNIKVPIKPDVLPSGHQVTPSTPIIFGVHAMGRMKSIWGDDCNEFKPERWIDERGMLKHEPSYKFPIFGAGPRSCLGKRMSIAQMKLVAAIIIQNYHIEAIEGHHDDPDLSLVLHMANGFKVKVEHAHQC